MFAQSIGTTFTWCGNHVGLLSHYAYTGFYTFEIQVPTRNNKSIQTMFKEYVGTR